MLIRVSFRPPHIRASVIASAVRAIIGQPFRHIQIHLTATFFTEPERRPCSAHTAFPVVGIAASYPPPTHSLRFDGRKVRWFSCLPFHCIFVNSYSTSHLPPIFFECVSVNRPHPVPPCTVLVLPSASTRLVAPSAGIRMMGHSIRVPLHSNSLVSPI